MSQSSDTSEYYSKVGAYYDQDASMFESRYCVNETAQRIRNSFREETECFPFTEALEIGFGPGIDLVYFARKYPERQFAGIDLSQQMFDYARKQISKAGLENVNIRLSSLQDIGEQFPGRRFDLIYIYFGALNTVPDLPAAAAQLEKLLAPGGKIVVTMINKWYLAGIFLPLVKGRTRVAFLRLKEKWGGYSPNRYLESRCYTPRDVRKAFPDFRIIRKRGYSIFFPAWYQDGLRPKMGKLYKALWKLDQFVNNTFLWSKGEYTLFALQRR